jgi:hypothetical protein
MFAPRLISSAVARLHEGMGCATQDFVHCRYHGSAAPTGPWRGTTAVLGEQMTWGNNFELSETTAKAVVNQV